MSNQKGLSLYEAAKASGVKFYNELINNDKWLNKNIKKEVTRVHKEGNDHNSELKFTRLGLGVRINSKIINIDDSNSNSEVFGQLQYLV